MAALITCVTVHSESEVMGARDDDCRENYRSGALAGATGSLVGSQTPYLLANATSRRRGAMYSRQRQLFPLFIVISVILSVTTLLRIYLVHLVHLE